jgi:hypothetical protein
VLRPLGDDECTQSEEAPAAGHGNGAAERRIGTMRRAASSGGGGGGARGRGRGGSAARSTSTRSRRRMEESETTTEEEADEEDAAGVPGGAEAEEAGSLRPRSRQGRRGVRGVGRNGSVEPYEAAVNGDGGSAAAGEGQGTVGEDSYIVDCPCGVRYDDGAMMVECEVCKTWAHIDCLQQQASSQPGIVYDLNNYVCLPCQMKRGTVGLHPFNMAALAALGFTAAPGACSGGVSGGAGGAAGFLGAHGATLLAAAGGLPPGPLAQLAALVPKAQTAAPADAAQADASRMLLGLAGLDAPAGGSSVNGGAPAAAMAAAAAAAAAGGSLALVPSLGAPGLLGAAGSGGEFLDPLSLLLASTRPNSALGSRSSPRTAAAVAAAAGGVGSPSSKGVVSGGGGGVGGPSGLLLRPESTALDAALAVAAAHSSERAASSQGNLEALLVAAGAQEAADAQEAAATGKGAGSSGVRQQQPANGKAEGGAGNVAGDVGGVLAAAGTPSSPTTAAAVGQPHATAMAQLAQLAAMSHAHAHAHASGDVLMQLLATNRSATPSQMLIESLIRGSTPDLGPHPFLSNTMQAAAQMQILQLQQQYGLPTGGIVGAPLGPVGATSAPVATATTVTAGCGAKAPSPLPALAPATTELQQGDGKGAAMAVAAEHNGEGPQGVTATRATDAPAAVDAPPAGGDAVATVAGSAVVASGEGVADLAVQPAAGDGSSGGPPPPQPQPAAAQVWRMHWLACSPVACVS